MKNQTTSPTVVSSISEQHRQLDLPKPQHPLVSVFRFEDVHYAEGVSFGLPAVV